MFQQRHAWRSYQKKHRKPIFKENIQKSKKEEKNQKLFLQSICYSENFLQQVIP